MKGPDNQVMVALNDYVVMEIFSYLSIEDLLNVSTLSDQFNDCVNRLVKRIPFIKIGCFANAYEYDCSGCLTDPIATTGHTNDEDYDKHLKLELIDRQRVRRSNRWFAMSTDLLKSERRLGPLFTEKMVNIRSLVLNDIVVTKAAVRLVDEWFPRLQCLTFGINTYVTDDYHSVAERLATRLRHLHLNAFGMRSTAHLSAFVNLVSLSLSRFHDTSLSVDHLLDSLGPNVRTLTLWSTSTMSFVANIDRDYLISNPKLTNLHHVYINGVQIV